MLLYSHAFVSSVSIEALAVVPLFSPLVVLLCSYCTRFLLLEPKQELASETILSFLAFKVRFRRGVND